MARIAGHNDLEVVAIGITQSFQFFGLHTSCPQNLWPVMFLISVIVVYLIAGVVVRGATLNVTLTPSRAAIYNER